MISWSHHTDANANGIPVLGISTHTNFRASNTKKKRQSWKRSIRCHGYTANEKRILQGLMYRRQLLLASTALPFKPQQMMAAMPPPPNLTNYHKLANAVQEAEKLKNSPHGRVEINDALRWPSKPPNSRTPDELPGAVAVPPAQDLLRCDVNKKEVVTARIRRPEPLDLRLQDKEEQLVLQGIEVTDDEPLCFDVCMRIGQEGDDEEEDEYVGTLSHMPPRRKQRGHHDNKAAFDGHHEQKRVRKCCLRLGMNDMLTDRPDLDAHHAESVIVKLVPTFKVHDDPIKVESIFIDHT